MVKSTTNCGFPQERRKKKRLGGVGEAIGFSKLYLLEFYAPLSPCGRKPWSIFMLALLILITTP